MADEKGDCGDHEATLNDSNVSDHDPHFEPIITLPEVNISTLEEEEEEMIKLRAKLFRFDSSETPSEWKERGTGDVKLLRHPQRNTVRVVMRRDKTLKICANHFVTPWMELKPNCGSDRAWVWSVPADFADEIPRPELLAIRFATPENAKKWKSKFEEAKDIAKEYFSEEKNEGGVDVKSCHPLMALFCSLTGGDAGDYEDESKEEVSDEEEEVDKELEKLHISKNEDKEDKTEDKENDTTEKHQEESEEQQKTAVS